MKSTQCGVNMNLANPQQKFFTRDYVNAKYDGLDRRMQRVILHPYFQVNYQLGKSIKTL
jgi:hypothetical protein